MRCFSTLSAAAGLLMCEADRAVRIRVAAGLCLMLLAGAVAALGPLALKDMVDALSTARDAAEPSRVLALGAAYLAALGSARVIGELRPWLVATAEQRLLDRLRRRFFGHVVDLPMRFHAVASTGSLAQTLAQGTSGCQLLISSAVSVAPIAVELATVAAVLAHLGQPGLLASFMLGALAYGAIYSVGVSRIKVHAQAVSAANLATHASLADSLLNVETIKTFNVQSNRCAEFAARSATLHASWGRLHSHRAKFGLLIAATFTASVAASLTVAARSVEQGSLSIGGFVLTTVYMLQLIRPLEVLGTAARDMAQGLEFVRPALDILAAPVESGQVSPSPTWQSLDAQPASLRFAGVHLAYDAARPVLRGLDLDVAAGRTLAIVGASGSGKSSLVRLILRLYDPQCGCVLFQGKPVEHMAIHDLRSRIALVSQDTTLFDDTIAGNIEIGRPGATRADIEEAAGRAQLHHFIRSLPAGYDTRVGERGLRLSGGERQRVAIARAILKRPQIILFDEATSMLDGRTEAELTQHLKQACVDKTVVIVTHRLLAARHADAIAVLEEGRITEHGSHALLMALGGSYARMWHAQMSGGAEQPLPDAVPA